MDLTGRDRARFPTGLAAAGARFVTADRHDAAELYGVFGHGADLLVDCVCFTGGDAELLLPLARDAGSTVMISSKTVYVDRDGNHSNSDVAPRFDRPVPESQPTVAPGAGDVNTREGYGSNKVAAEQALLDSGEPVTVLRPSKVHGAGSRRPREWVFVKRVLDRRPAVFLAHGGAGVDHTTAAANIAALVELVAAKPGRRILNVADPDAPSALEISRTIARHLGHEWTEVLLDDGAETRRRSWRRSTGSSLRLAAARTPRSSLHRTTRTSRRCSSARPRMPSRGGCQTPKRVCDKFSTATRLQRARSAAKPDRGARHRNGTVTSRPQARRGSRAGEPYAGTVVNCGMISRPYASSVSCCACVIR